MKKQIEIGDLLDLERELSGVEISEEISRIQLKETKIIMLKEIQLLVTALQIGEEKTARKTLIDIFVTTLDLDNILISQERREEYKISLEEAYTNTFKEALAIKEVIENTPMMAFLLSLTNEIDNNRNCVKEIVTLSIHLGLSQKDLYSGALELLGELEEHIQGGANGFNN